MIDAIMDNQPQSDQETMITLGSDLRVGRATELFDMLAAAVDTPGTLAIDAAQVSKIDAAGLQSLTAAVVRLRTAGTRWRWHNESPALVSAAKMLGLDEVLELR